jgi:hypothetical protein
MSVYIDQARNAYRRMVMGHMVADSVLDLFEMAQAIGMHSGWFQPRSFPHFDVSLTRRDLARARGALDVDRREIVRVMRRYRLRLDQDPYEKRALDLLVERPCYDLAAELRSAQR